MVMLWCFVVLSQQTATVIRTSPRSLLTDRDRFSGSWELSPNSRFDKSGVIIVPENSTNRFGHAWRLTRTPPHFWNATFEFGITDPTSHIRGGIYLTAEFGPYGPIFGGPEEFTGAAILFEIQKNRISYEYRVNDGKTSYFDNSMMPVVHLQIFQKEFKIRVEFTEEGKIRVISDIQNKPILIYDGVSRTSVKKCWLGVTAEANNTEISLRSVRSSFTDDTSFGIDSPIPDPIIIGNSNEVLDEILKIGKLVNRSAKVKPTRDAVEQAMYKHADAWNRRSYRMTDETAKMRSNLTTQLDIFRNNMHMFEKLLLDDINSVKHDAKKIGEELINGLHPISQTDTPRSLTKLIMQVIMVTELFIVIAVLRRERPTPAFVC